MTREEQQLPEGEISNKELLVNHGFEVMSKKQELLAKFDKAVPINKELLLSLAGIFSMDRTYLKLTKTWK